MNTHYQTLQEQYKAWLQALGFSGSICYNYPKMLYYFFRYLQDKGTHKIALVNNTHLKDYIEYLQTRKHLRKQKALSTAHLNKSFDMLDKFCEFLNHKGFTGLLPPKYRILQTRENYISKIRVLTKQEIAALYTSCQKLYLDKPLEHRQAGQATARLALDLCYGCGLRRSEACNLQISEIDWDKNLLFVYQGKGYKDRFVPVSPQIKDRLQRYIYQDRRYYNCNHSRVFPFTSQMMYQFVKELGKLSGYTAKTGKYLTLHILRHSIATHLLQNGMPTQSIALFLGHSSLESTQIYTHILSKDESL